MIFADIWESCYTVLEWKKKEWTSILFVFHNLKTSILNINKCLINLKTLKSSSIFHSLSLKEIWHPLGTKIEARTNGLTLVRAGTEDTVKAVVRKTQD